MKKLEKVDETRRLYEKAVKEVEPYDRVGISLLQRRLEIGYSSAARLMDMLEEKKIVGPPDRIFGTREVLINKNDK